jgi:mono/diheme cytochrome c family protein
MGRRDVGGRAVRNLLAASLLLALAAVSAGLGFAYSGRADVAATSPHWAMTRWVLSTAMENAVERQARPITPAPFLDEPARLEAGAVAYDAMCAQCHGAPGVKRGVVGEGLNPEPPDLGKSAEKWRLAEIFWITKHGIRMTGMPAFGSTHSDEELWEVVAVVKRLPDMSSAEYRRLADTRDKRPHEHRGEHSRQREAESNRSP